MTTAQRSCDHRHCSAIDRVFQQLHERQARLGRTRGSHLGFSKYTLLNKGAHGKFFLAPATGNTIETLDRHNTTKNQNFSQ